MTINHLIVLEQNFKMSQPFNHIAVVLRGHMRTWNFLREHNFRFFKSISTNVDYYLSTWDLPNHTQDKKQEIIDSFNDETLVKALFVNTSEFYQGTGLTAGWLTTKLLPFKKHRETTVTYNAVFETRPDIIVRQYPDTKIFKPENNTFYSIRTTPIETEFGVRDFLEDYFFMMSSDVFDVVSRRYHVQDSFKNTQVTIGEFIKRQGYQIKDVTWADPVIIRPSVLELGIDTDSVFDSSLDIANKNSPKWIDYSTEQKIKVCNQFNIDLEDYRCSGSGLIKIS